MTRPLPADRTPELRSAPSTAKRCEAERCDKDTNMQNAGMSHGNIMLRALCIPYVVTDRVEV